jgi:hypothetical protein
VSGVAILHSEFRKLVKRVRKIEYVTVFLNTDLRPLEPTLFSKAAKSATINETDRFFQTLSPWRNWIARRPPKLFPRYISKAVIVRNALISRANAAALLYHRVDESTFVAHDRPEM